MSKKIYLDNEGKEGLMRGIELLYKAVSSTLGPSGKTVIIRNGNEDPFTTKDGVTVAKSIDSDDDLLNVGMQMIKKVAIRMDEMSGDGTTGTTVICYNLLKEVLEGNYNVSSLKNEIQEALQHLLDFIDNSTINIHSESEIDFGALRNVAMVASNYDKELSDLISSATIDAGKYGRLNVVESIKNETEVEKVPGYLIDLGFADSSFGLDPATGFFVQPDVDILLLRNKLTDKQDYISIAEHFNTNSSYSLIIFAQDFSTEIINLCNYANRVIVNRKICLIRTNMRQNESSAIYEDLAAYTGANILDKYDGHSSDYGYAKDVVVKPGYTIFGETKEDLSFHITNLEERLSNEKNSGVKESIERRLARLNNNLVNLFVGGYSDIEVKEKFHRAQDAANACRMAMQGGVIIGGGQLLLKFTLLSEFLNQSQGHKVLCAAIASVTEQIFENCRQTEEQNFNDFKEDILKYKINEGYDFKNHQWIDLYTAGILDPAIIIKNSIINAVSVATTIFSTDCVIIEKTS